MKTQFKIEIPECPELTASVTVSGDREVVEQVKTYMDDFNFVEGGLRNQTEIR